MNGYSVIKKTFLIIIIGTIVLACGTQPPSFYEKSSGNSDGNFFDFIENAEDAVWHNDSNIISINKELNEINEGLVKIESRHEQKILTLIPKSTGFIHGAYLVSLPDNMDTINFKTKAYLETNNENIDDCHLTLSLLSDGELKSLASIELSKYASEKTVEINLSELNIETGILILGIDKSSHSFDKKITTILEAKLMLR